MSDTPSTAATWLGRQSVMETRGFTPEGQASGKQPTNASSFVEQLGDGAGSSEAHQGSSDLVNYAANTAHPPGSWSPAYGRSSIGEDGGLQHSVEEAGMVSRPTGKGLFGR